MRLFFCVSLTLLLSSASLVAQAWTRQGHQIVAELAARQLGPVARAEVQALLAGEAEPTLAGVSMWADDLRDNDPDLGKRSFRWHFMNFPRGQPCAYVPARDCPDGNCVIAVINTHLKILADRKQLPAARRQALKFVVHLVGDAHQPLHAGYRDDLGGNEHQINYSGEATNLHRIWDYWIVRSAGLETGAYVDRLLAAGTSGLDATLKSDNPAAEWALESCAIVQASDFYPAKGKLDERYLVHHRPVAERRLREAGRRLAGLIEAALGEGSAPDAAR